MKTIIAQVIQSVALGTVIPGLLFSAATDRTVKTPAVMQEVQPTIPVVLPIEPEEEFGPEQEEILTEIPIKVMQADGTLAEMDLEDYICRVVLGEMPASFDSEALKAQAVAARTYALRCCVGGSKHPQNAVCTSHLCCQAYCEPEEHIRSGGTLDTMDKVFQAVTDTAGQVLYYNNKLIMATYFSSAGATTEDARAVWGNSFPYLVPVESPEGEEAYQGKTVTFTAEKFQKLLGVTLKGKPSSWFGAITYTTGGGVDRIRIGNTSYKGTELRGLLGLRSTDFMITTTDTSVTFTTNGNGHRVGMSQYGAEAMAVTGCSYQQILAHYYTGAELGIYSPSND